MTKSILYQKFKIFTVFINNYPNNYSFIWSMLILWKNRAVFQFFWGFWNFWQKFSKILRFFDFLSHFRKFCEILKNLLIFHMKSLVFSYISLSNLAPNRENRVVFDWFKHQKCENRLKAIKFPLFSFMAKLTFEIHCKILVKNGSRMGLKWV